MAPANLAKVEFHNSGCLTSRAGLRAGASRLEGKVVGTEYSVDWLANVTGGGTIGLEMSAHTNHPSHLNDEV